MAAARWYAALCAFEVRAAGALLVAMVLLILLGGVARLLGHPLNWSTDAATALFAWACFLCADVAWRRDSLMGIELLTARLPPPARAALRDLNLGLIALFLLYLIVLGLWLSWTSRVRSFQGMPAVSYSWVTMSLPVGSALLLLTTLNKLRAAARGEPAPPPGAAADVL